MGNWNAVQWTPEMDAQVRRVYERKERGGNKRLAGQWNLPASRVSWRAAILGLSPLICVTAKGLVQSWTDPELAILQAHSGQSIRHIRAILYKKGYQRSLASVKSAMNRLRAIEKLPTRREAIEDSNSLTTQEISTGLGIEYMVVFRWVKNGWLRARKIGDDGLMAIRWIDLQKFLVDYAAHWDHRTADHWFLIEILTYTEHSTKKSKS
jgi:hypothetical protein